ncbi:uncharacterized protein BO72DRAFT_246610 [Aspergillus fijiensis CBS 313.89]|uniref:Uncharacterized protein n=1 Tax=Aspergillus fijiensis CBS 313.89 TaxID=1448319 RepID=A0A8G1VUS3_9EURO|nr:uncharacterized protein BO72DRAFT_246610 [Aspergillus fijiensis CBS 313.89]RAK73367.1 hypothetical protein BO72DRAFT_246610 [Aspergillus fijiensis CBS 313.89]
MPLIYLRCVDRKYRLTVITQLTAQFIIVQTQTCVDLTQTQSNFTSIDEAFSTPSHPSTTCPFPIQAKLHETHTPVPEKNRPICIPSAPSRVPDRKEGKGWEGGGDGKQKKKSENKKRAKIGPGGGRSRRNRMEESWNPWVGKSHPFGGCDTGAMIS